VASGCLRVPAGPGELGGDVPAHPETSYTGQRQPPSPNSASADTSPFLHIPPPIRDQNDRRRYSEVSLAAVAASGLDSFWLLALIATYPLSMASTDWLLAAEVLARYFLYLPGAALAGLAVFFHCRVLWEMKLPHIARDCLGAAVALGLKAILAGLVVSPALYFPASFLNESSFLAVVGVPVQVFRTITALAIAYFIVRTLAVFEIERSRQLEVATQQRF